MTDSAFTNDTVATATDLNVLAFPNSSFEGPSSSRFFRFDSVGAGYNPPFTTDLNDFFEFTPYLLETVEISFDASRVGSYVNGMALVPISGVSKVAGAIISNWYGGEHDSRNDEGNFTAARNRIDSDSISYFNGTVANLPAIDFSEAFVAFDPSIEAKAIWTLTGEPVVFQILGYQLEGTQEQIIENKYNAVEIRYDFTLIPKSGLPDAPLTLAYIDNPNVSENFKGSNGLDTYGANLARDEVNVSRDSNGIVTIQPRNNPAAADTLESIERVLLSDGILAFDIDGHAGQAYRIYQAAFDRTPDTPGVSFWIHSLDDGLGGLEILAASFINSAEFQALYGTPATVTNAQFINLMYLNVLDRAADQGGLDFWTAQINAGVSREQILVNFSESAENQAERLQRHQ